MNLIASVALALVGLGSFALAEAEFHRRPRCHSSSSLSSSSSSHHHHERPVNCHRGRPGPPGKQGWPGPDGLIGQQGPSGANGKNGTYSISNFFINVYYDEPYGTLNLGDYIPLTKLQSISAPTDFSPAGFAVSPSESGVFLITYNIAIYENEAFSEGTTVGIYVNDIYVPQSKYWSSNGKYYIVGQALVPVEAGQTIGIKSLNEGISSLWMGNVDGATLFGVNASMMIVRVSNTTALTSAERIDG